MRGRNEKGMTLAELLIAISILGIIASATTALVSVSLQAHGHGAARSQLYREGLLAMERMTSRAKRCTFLLIPHSHDPTRDILAFSGFGNDDDDYYFNDPLFPRIDEDVRSDMTSDNRPGIKDYDDDGDGKIDERLNGFVDWGGLTWEDNANDDEGAGYNEDPLDGMDNDMDGNVDEDVSGDMNADGFPGIKGIDDDGDGQVDEIIVANSIYDDDEDGFLTEDWLNPLIYSWNSGTDTLSETNTATGQTTELSTHVTFFEVRYFAPERILIRMTLTGEDGETVEYAEYVYIRNTYQRTGKRVR